jgi:hypothetical protein
MRAASDPEVALVRTHRYPQYDCREKGPYACQ